MDFEHAHKPPEQEQDFESQILAEGETYFKEG
jgi:hypothetical protein